MSEYMSIFQIGPVQEFIQTARKTQDYWAGSFLLSFLNARAIHAFGGENVVFPNIVDSKLYQAAKIDIPWKGTMIDDYYRSSLPNRFFAVTKENPSELLKNTKQIVFDDFKKIASIICDKIQKQSNNNFFHDQIAIWDDQINNRSFEILYVWRQKSDSEDYNTAYAEIEILLGSRKATRVFNHHPGQNDGYTCSLCGLRTALGSNKCNTREEMRNWWNNNMRKNTPSAFKFRDGEYLCSVCTLKRLAPEIVFKSSLDIPSTSSMAVSGFVRDILNLKDTPSFQKIATKYDTFQGAAKEAANGIDEPPATKWPDFLCIRNSKIQPQVDGDWYYESFYDHQVNKKNMEIETKKKILKAKDAWCSFIKKCRDEKPDILQPSHYFAILAADGDSMGSLLQNIKENDKNTHKLLSQLLIQFSAKHIPDIIEKKYPGYVLYWGGDEGVAMVCLEDLFNVMNDLREEWHTCVEVPLKQKILNDATLSVGAVIVHHQYPLRSAIAEAQQTLETAKMVTSYRRKKDAWSIRIIRRSGGPVTARAHWHYDTFNPLSHLEDFQQAYRKSWLSPKWLADIRSEQLALADPKHDLPSESKRKQWENSCFLYEHESKRLIERHISKEDVPGKKQMLKKLIADHETMNKKISGILPHANFQRFKDITAMMDLAQYVAKGGGR